MLHVKRFQSITKLQYEGDITTYTICEWLGSVDVSNQTKLTRLKCLKTFLSRCFGNGWIQMEFWKMINIKVDQKEDNDGYRIFYSKGQPIKREEDLQILYRLT
ncbi:hypothetical protein CU084_14725 [Bacillus velezensis]|nr:hypothetical protein CU084_14725 [Bacillus velezensis]